ncbi:arginyl-tRNA synthetase [Toxoplasma gondii ME49]|uniref:Arginyl-tRNA synthetase n=3 Tax=Toxoplasma gondii TaxID=5811 RepID=S8GIW4_TOXGM|nr:arginyl-tRNA synthetase [Toxoplasma gondii ME49]EPT28439.1 arginyl-tRNA synthetase [Toxoplasma gondii ME49]KYF46786.1 arginyl-tRNA synthetase [Toxoplasma gondii ARI]|eukprot:XP_002365735.1 arginyl-tRNA synthetase [Toxoplasma gondii ME49]
MSNALPRPAHASSDAMGLGPSPSRASQHSSFSSTLPSSSREREAGWNEADDEGPEAEHQPRLLETLQDVPKPFLDKARGIVEQLRGREGEQATLDANSAYLLCFQLLKLAGLEAEIPRLVVFGQQSMGKTTLLDYIMGGPIGYSSTDTGTRQPVVILLRPSESADSVQCWLGGEEIEVKELQARMKEIMSSQGERISSQELEVELAVPNGVHAVFVDLPGVKDDSKAGATQTRSVVRTYVQNNPNDLYILVKKASDDPANWPWSLREFILSAPPKGLGLTPRQTVVVGTRAKEFLVNEKNDIRTQSQLLERVLKRAVKDSSGAPLPLFLLELFSLSIEEKDALDFAAKRAAMNRQMDEGGRTVRQLLETAFEPGPNPQLSRKLTEFFSPSRFKKELNHKFQSLLSEQMGILERRLVRKRLETQKRISDLEDQLALQSPQSCRECIKLYLRELMQVVTELVTGNYTIIRLPHNGDEFLKTFGGNLRDNLEDGHELACDLFPEHYDRGFLTKIIKEAEEVFRRQDLEESLAPVTGPDGRVVMQPGHIVRYTLSKDDTNMFGLVQSVGPPRATEDSAESQGAAASDASALSSKEATVTFYFRSGQAQGEQSQFKTVDKQRLAVLLPLQTIIHPSTPPPAGFRCWRRFYRPDGWVGLQPVELLSLSLRPASVAFAEGKSSPTHAGASGGGAFDGLQGGEGRQRFSEKSEAVVKALAGPDLRSAANAQASEQVATLDELFADAATGDGERHSHAHRRTHLSALQRISGDFADTRLLNQLALTHLGRWLKFHICNIEPDRRFSDHVLLQMMRSVRHVIDKADWEPLVADLLQANVGAGMLQLARLAACAAASALRRILRAASAEVNRQIKCGDLRSGLLFLATNHRFMEELEQSLEEYTRKKARDCAQAMRDLIFEQTHAIHFEMIEDFFDGCKRFEADFLGGSMMGEVTQHVKDSLAMRKQRLGIADIYARQENGAGTPDSMIYEEVRIQFWVVKMLLSAPLTTKLYMHFIKDIKDKSMHLASEDKYSVTCENDLERTLQEQMLCERSPAGRALARTDEELMEHFNISMNKDELINQLNAARRTEEYTKLALEGVAKLLHQLQKGSGVDFLTRLDSPMERRASACRNKKHSSSGEDAREGLEENREGTGSAAGRGHTPSGRVGQPAGSSGRLPSPLNGA